MCAIQLNTVMKRNYQGRDEVCVQIHAAWVPIHLHGDFTLGQILPNFGSSVPAVTF